jgi:hypothetical protein
MIALAMLKVSKMTCSFKVLLSKQQWHVNIIFSSAEDN